MSVVPDPWYRERNQTDPWQGVQPLSMSSGQISLLTMTEEEAEAARKRKKKNPIGFGVPKKKKS